MPDDSSATLTADFKDAWQTERLTRTSPSLFRVLRRLYLMKFVPIGVLCYVLDIACRCVNYVLFVGARSAFSQIFVV